MTHLTAEQEAKIREEFDEMWKDMATLEEIKIWLITRINSCIESDRAERARVECAGIIPQCEMKVK